AQYLDAQRVGRRDQVRDVAAPASQQAFVFETTGGAAHAGTLGRRRMQVRVLGLVVHQPSLESNRSQAPGQEVLQLSLELCADLGRLRNTEGAKQRRGAVVAHDRLVGLGRLVHGQPKR